jgi:hypothetical protein
VAEVKSSRPGANRGGLSKKQDGADMSLPDKPAGTQGAKATPGPWGVQQSHRKVPVVCGAGLDNGGIIANTGQTARPHAEKLANAHLMSAAPELYEALVALMGTCCHLRKWETQWPNVITKCRAAISKAEGKVQS